MVKFIEKATKEFEQNGRSDVFVAMENKIIKGGKPLQIYFFARFVKGAYAKRLQSAMMKFGSLEQCYYFQKYVQGSNIVPFVKMAVEHKDVFWIKKFAELAREQETYSKVEDMVAEFEQIKSVGILGRTAFDINEIIFEAQNEYKKYGRSAYFIELEKSALHSNIVADAKLFAYNVEGANVKLFDHVAFMKCDPFEMYFMGTNVNGSDAELMYRGLELAKLNYIEVEKSNKDLQTKREQVLKQLQFYKQCHDETEYKRWYDTYKRLPVIPEYLAQIEGLYMPPVKYVLRRQGKLK